MEAIKIVIEKKGECKFSLPEIPPVLIPRKSSGKFR